MKYEYHYVECIFLYRAKCCSTFQKGAFNVIVYDLLVQPFINHKPAHEIKRFGVAIITVNTFAVNRHIIVSADFTEKKFFHVNNQ